MTRLGAGRIRLSPRTALRRNYVRSVESLILVCSDRHAMAARLFRRGARPTICLLLF